MKRDSVNKRTIQLFIPLTVVFSFLFYAIFPELPSNPMLKDAFWASKVSLKKKGAYSLVCIGDSRIYRGIDPEVFNRSGISAFNAGFSAAGLHGAYLDYAENLLSEELNTTLLIGVTPYSLCKRAAANEHYSQEKNRNRSENLIRETLYPLFSFTGPYSFSDFSKMVLGRAYYETFYPNGWVASVKVPQDSTLALKEYANRFHEQKISTDIYKSFIQRLHRWETEGIRIVVFRPPVSHGMSILEDRVSGLDYKRLREDVEKAGGEYLILNNSYQSYDGSHLDSIAARRLSIEVFHLLDKP